MPLLKHFPPVPLVLLYLIIEIFIFILFFFSNLGQSELVPSFNFFPYPFSRYEDSAGVCGPYTLYEAAGLPIRHLNLVHVGCFPAGQRPASFLRCVLVFFLTPANNILTPCGASTCFLPSQNGNSSFSRSASFPKFLRCPESTAFAAAQTQTAEEEDVNYNKGNVTIHSTA